MRIALKITETKQRQQTTPLIKTTLETQQLG